MAENSKIEWAHHTFNPWYGCQPVGPGCDHCYAEGWAKRSGLVQWGPGAERRRSSAANWKKPLRWDRQAEIAIEAWEKFKATQPGLTDQALEAQGFVKPVRPRVFCASLADVFDNAVPAEWRADLFRVILQTPYLDWLLVTKRIGNAHRLMEEAVYRVTGSQTGWPWHNVWLGITVCNQAEANRDIPKLLAVPARVRWLSIEPLLGPVDLSRWIEQIDHCGFCGVEHEPGQVVVRDSGADVCPSCGTENVTISTWGHEQAERYRTGERYNDESTAGRADIDGTSPTINWVVAGGESGPKARPMRPDWARSLRDQCAAAAVPFLFKQWGEWFPTSIGQGGSQLGAWNDDDFMPGWVDIKNSENNMVRAGKRAFGGRLLDGVLHDGYPNLGVAGIEQ